jgi:hypothetical protein
VIKLTTARSLDSADVICTVECESSAFKFASAARVIYSAAPIKDANAYLLLAKGEGIGKVTVNATLHESDDSGESLLEISELEIGFIQYLKLEEFSATYAGATTNAGAMRIKPFKTLPTVFPDSGGIRKPWTIEKSKRVYKRTKNPNFYTSFDQPTWYMPVSIKNELQHGADNFIQSWRWKFKILCALVRHNQYANSADITPKTIIASSVWDFDFDCTFSWVNEKINFEKNDVKRTFGRFDFEPKRNEEFQIIYSPLANDNQLSEAFLVKEDYNVVANREVKKAVEGVSLGREEMSSWPSDIPSDFYTKS